MTSITSKINVKTDSIYSALRKKANNTSLSDKTLNKLMVISNRRLGMCQADAKDIFIKNFPVNNMTFASKTLAINLSKVVNHISNNEVRQSIQDWIINCNVPDWMISQKVTTTKTIAEVTDCFDFIKINADRLGNIIGEGCEAMVFEDRLLPNKVIKVFNDDISSYLINNQVKAFNQFYGNNAAQIISGRGILMNKIDGTPLSKVNSFRADACDQFISLLNEMCKKQCPPADMSEDNFLYNSDNGQFYPIDITKIATQNGNINRSEINYILNFIANKIDQQ